MAEYETIIYQQPAPNVARIVMNRPDARNAQNLQMTYDLNAAFDRAVQDDAVKVIVLAGADPHFSSGHDLRATGKNKAGTDFPPISWWGGFDEPNAHGRFAREQEIYLQITRRWRNLAKPTIAEVQGRCIAGGLMLAWACDLIVASDDAEFCDPVVTMGVCGVEWFVHPFELGPRKAKELLFTADRWTAQEAHRLGMVNHVVPRKELQAFVLDLAGRIASKPCVRAEDDQGSGQPRDGRLRPAGDHRARLRAASALPRAQSSGVRHGGRPGGPAPVGAEAAAAAE